MQSLADLGAIICRDVSPGYGNAQGGTHLEERAVGGFEAIAGVASAAAESLSDVESDAIERTSELATEIPIALLYSLYQWP
jgi:hypothetical protein